MRKAELKIDYESDHTWKERPEGTLDENISRFAHYAGLESSALILRYLFFFFFFFFIRDQISEN